jgi:phosphoribosyl 1,2-cyclic phosphate phosphodiesterase
MELTILGSAAAEAWPGLYCACLACAEAKKRGDKDIRTRTAYALGETIRVDLGPDTYHQCLASGNTLIHLRHLLFTHSHLDHCSPDELFYRRRGFSHLESDEPLRVYGTDLVRQRLLDHGVDWEVQRIEFVPIKAFETVRLESDVQASALLADHGGDEEALNYILRCGGKSVLIGNDTGWWPEKTWEFLSDFTLDVVVLDCTGGPLDYRQGHLGIEGVKAAKEELTKQGSLAPDCRFIANHFSHNGGWLHAELEAVLAEADIETGYDGMAVELLKQHGATA